MDKSRQRVLSLKLLILIIFIVWLLITIIIWIVFKDWSKSGVFGDTFGAINSLFSGLALAGIIYTIYLQKRELQLQRDELALTRRELTRSASAQESSFSLMNEQLRLNNMPYFDYSIQIVDGISHLVISNNSNNVSFDVNVICMFPTFEKINSRDDFVEEYVYNKLKEVYSSKSLKGSDRWGIYDMNRIDIFNNQKHIVCPLVSPIPISSSILMNVQFRDKLDNVYSQSILFSIGKSPQEHSRIDHMPKMPKLSNYLYFNSTGADLSDKDFITIQIYELMENSIRMFNTKEPIEGTKRYQIRLVDSIKK